MTIPVTVVTGFLGAGKTTLINHVLHHTTIPNEQIAIIVNEFGEIGIDHQLILDVDETVIQLNNGCICCTLRKDIEETLNHLEETFRIRHKTLSNVIIETTGLADPFPIIQTITQHNAIQRTFHIDSVLTLIDCLNYQTVIKRYDEAKQQIMLADRFVLTKTEKCLGRQIKRIKQELSAINPVADCLLVTPNSDLQEDDFFNVALFSNNEMTFNPTPIATHPHKHDDEFGSICLTTDKPLTHSQVISWIDSLLIYHSDFLYRYKGIIYLSEQESPIVLQGVHTQYTLTNSDALNTSNVTTIVLIGKYLDKESITDSFHQLLSH